MHAAKGEREREQMHSEGLRFLFLGCRRRETDSHELRPYGNNGARTQRNAFLLLLLFLTRVGENKVARLLVELCHRVTQYSSSGESFFLSHRNYLGVLSKRTCAAKKKARKERLTCDIHALRLCLPSHKTAFMLQHCTLFISLSLL